MMKRSRVIASVFAFLLLLLFLSSAIAAGDDGFLIPQATITVDGNTEDWTGIPLLVNDRTQDVFGVPQIDIEKAFIAKDDTFLYFRVDFIQDIDIFHNSPENGIGNGWGNCRFESYDAQRNIDRWFIVGLGGKAAVQISDLHPGGINDPIMEYPPTAGFAAYRGKTVEYKVRLADTADWNLDGRPINVVSFDGNSDGGDDTFPTLLQVEGPAPLKTIAAPDLKVEIRNLSVVLSWDAVPYAEGYNIHYAFPTNEERIDTTMLSNNFPWFQTDFSFETLDGFAVAVAVVPFNTAGAGNMSNIIYFKKDLQADSVSFKTF